MAFGGSLEDYAGGLQVLRLLRIRGAERVFKIVVVSLSAHAASCGQVPLKNMSGRVYRKLFRGIIQVVVSEYAILGKDARPTIWGDRTSFLCSTDAAELLQCQLPHNTQ